MDQEDSQNIYKRINHLEINNKENLQLIKEEVLLARSNYEKNEQVMTELKAGLQESREQIDQLIAGMIRNQNFSNSGTELAKLQAREELSEVTRGITIHLQELEYQTNNLFIILVTLTAGHLHPLVLSYEQVESMINTITEENEKKLDAYAIESLAKVHGAHLGDKIICTITIPLLLDETFAIKKIYSLPMETSNNVIVHYRLEADYLVTSLGANKMLLWGEEEVSTCTHLETTDQNPARVCKIETPIYSTPGKSCTLLLYVGWPEASQRREKIQIQASHNIITKMKVSNAWLYHFKEGMKAKISCPQFETNVIMEGQGILSLTPKCAVEIGNALLLATSVKQQTLETQQTNIAPFFDIEDIKLPITTTNNTNTSLIYFQHHKLHQEHIHVKNKELESLLNKIKQTEKEREQQKQHHNTRTWTITLGVVLNIALILLTTWALIKKCCKKNKKENSTPTPSTSPFTISLTPEVTNAKRNPIFSGGLPEFTDMAPNDPFSVLNSKAYTSPFRAHTPLSIRLPTRDDTEKINLRDFNLSKTPQK